VPWLHAYVRFLALHAAARWCPTTKKWSMVLVRLYETNTKPTKNFAIGPC
jgi:hypothetical protein